MSRDLKDNREKMDFELGIAKKIQTAILPEELNVGSVEALVHYNPLYTVSGDFYDIRRLNDGSTAIFIGDASGHGVPAAFITIMAKLFFTEFVKINPDPGYVLNQMNQAMAGYFEGAGLYMTAFYMRVFPDNRAIFCNAMHPEPIVIRKNGTVELIESTAFYVGMMKEVFKEYETAEIRFQPGDRLVLYTDGFTEAKDVKDEIFTPERFHELFRTNAALDSASLMKYAMLEVGDFSSGAKRSDDETLMILNFQETESPISEIERNTSSGEEVLSENPYYIQMRKLFTQEIQNGKPLREIWTLADKFLKEKDFITALAAYHAFAEAHGEDVPVLFRIALCYYRIRSLGDCARILKRCLDLNPEAPDTHALFSLLSLKTGDLGKALSHIEKAVEETPDTRRYNGVLKKIKNGLDE